MNLRSCFLPVLMVCLAFVFDGGWSQKTELRLQFLVPQESDANRIYHNDATIPAAQMAVYDINRNPDYLPNYNLTVEFSDTQCDPSEGTWQMIKSVLDTSGSNQTKIISFIGGSCSLVTEPTAALSGRLYKVVQISYASASPILSDRGMYPLFYRTYPSQNTYNNVYFALMNMYNWCIVATLHQTVNVFSLAVTDFHEQFENVLRNTTCTDKNDKPILFSFTGDPEIPLTQIKSKDVRIIIGYFYEDKAVVVLCYAKKMGLIGSKYQWILPGWYTDNWWEAADTMDWSGYRCDCTSKDIEKAADYILLVDFYTYPVNPSTRSLSGYTPDGFRTEYNKYLERFQTSDLYKGNQSSVSYIAYETLSYDAIWALAIALNKTENVIREDRISLADFDYSKSRPETSTIDTSIDDSNNTLISYNLSYFMSKTNFEGVSGNVRFDENGDRFGYSILSQYRLNGGYLERNNLSIHNYQTEGLNITFDSEPEWRTGDRPPTDRSTPINTTIDPSLVITMDLFIAIGIAVAIALLVFNTVTIMMPLIKNSAPLINTVIIVGCIMLMCTCILLGIDSNNPKVVDGELDLTNIPESAKDRYATICTVRLWLLTIGFTLSFGALFSKTWQVYRVYTNPTKLKDKPFKIWNFLIIMGIQLLLDLIFLSIWTGIYRFTRDIDRKTTENTVQVYEFCNCDKFSYLIGTLYVYKGLMVIFGLFLAYESRNVKYFYINDSRFVSIAMYIVVILIGISAPLSLVLSEERFVDPAYGVATFMITLACMCCLLIIYIPKFYYMAEGAETMIPKAKMEAFTPVDRLQLGRSEVNPDDIQNADKKIEDLKEQVQQKDYELKELEKRRGSDQDSGVMCTTDETLENSNQGSPTTVDNTATCNTTATMETMLSDHSCDGGETGGESVDSRSPPMLEDKIKEVIEEEEEEEENETGGTKC